MTKHLEVYNLEFEWPDEDMKIANYKFVPKTDYIKRFKSLSHGLPFLRPAPYGNIPRSNGSHISTGTVLIPSSERNPCLPWAREDATELDDILLLLSLFTQRRVLLFEEEGTEGIIADHREFHYGGTLALSLPQISRGSESETQYTQALSSGVSHVNALIRSDAWQSTYSGGYFLFLFLSACQRQILETSFLTCWTIWEHLFRLHNEHWISRGTLRRLAAKEKITFILTEYGLREKISEADWKSVQRLTRIRHRLTHDGSFEQEEDSKAADLFIRLTEFVISKTLGLQPSEVFSQKERLDRFSRGELL